jgi:hypothetical protein
LTARARIDTWSAFLNLIEGLYRRWRHLVHEMA